MEDTLSKHVMFATQVMSLSLDSYDLSDTLNGLCLASAASLIDVTMDENKIIDQEKLDANIKTFFDNITASVKLAKAQMEAGSV